MIVYIQNNLEYITSYIDFTIVNKDGITTENGEYIYVRDLWVHPTLNAREVISFYIDKLHNHPASKNTKYVYWVRELDGRNHKSRLFKREICAKKYTKVGGCSVTIAEKE